MLSNIAHIDDHRRIHKNLERDNTEKLLLFLPDSSPPTEVLEQAVIDTVKRQVGHFKITLSSFDQEYCVIISKILRSINDDQFIDPLVLDNDQFVSGGARDHCGR